MRQYNNANFTSCSVFVIDIEKIVYFGVISISFVNLFDSRSLVTKSYELIPSLEAQLNHHLVPGLKVL